MRVIISLLSLCMVACDPGTQVSVNQTQTNEQNSGGEESDGLCTYECRAIGTEFVDVVETCDGEITSSDRVVAGAEPVACVYAQSSDEELPL